MLTANGHNFTKLWHWEGIAVGEDGERIHPLPWPVSGSARDPVYHLYDGTPDLSSFDAFYAGVQFDDAYFDRLCERVNQARDRGLNPVLMDAFGDRLFHHTGDPARLAAR
ncbi:MAG: hypothetical protein GY719_18525 [bacterium]|nr:hypothetical protein [bacterium]